MIRPVALVTGAAQGIGLETAKRLSATHRLVLLDLNAERLEEVRPLCGEDAVAVVCDIAEQDQVTAAIAEVVERVRRHRRRVLQRRASAPAARCATSTPRCSRRSST